MACREEQPLNAFQAIWLGTLAVAGGRILTTPWTGGRHEMGFKGIRYNPAPGRWHRSAGMAC